MFVKNGPKYTNAYDFYLGNVESSLEMKCCKISTNVKYAYVIQFTIQFRLSHFDPSYIRLKLPKFFKTFPKHLKFYLHCCTYKFCCI